LRIPDVVVGLFILKPVLSCHKHRFKHFNFQYIYLISYKNAKKANPVKWICPFKKTISQQLQGSDIYIFIADTCNVEKQHLSLKKAEPDDPAHF
jgi:hypothetical protein